jgi:hypothetical protein
MSLLLTIKCTIPYLNGKDNEFGPRIMQNDSLGVLSMDSTGIAMNSTAITFLMLLNPDWLKVTLVVKKLILNSFQKQFNLQEHYIQLLMSNC